MPQGLKAPGHEDAVLSLQEHHVRHSAQADHVGVIVQNGLLVAAEGAGQLEGHAHAGEIFVGVTAVGPVGIHHGNGGGEPVLALVMVGDDQIDAHFPAQLRLGNGGDAAVHTDDELDPLVMKLVDGNGVQAVALLQPGGNVADAIGTLTAQEVRQHTGGGDAVYVIVTEDGDFLPPVDGQTHPSGGQVHVGHQEGVIQLGAAVEVRVCLPGVRHAPGGQDHGAQRRISAGYQCVYSSGPGGLDIPNSILQGNTHPL